MKVAIIGAGNVGKALATSITNAGHDVTIAAKNSGERPGGGRARSARARPTATRPRWSARTSSSSRSRTRRGAQVADDIRDAVAGKTIIDVTNPLKPDYSGLATTDTSAAEELQLRLPDASVVKAFNTIFAGNQANPTREIDGYVAADDPKAKQQVIVTGRVDGLHGARRRPAQLGALPRGDGVHQHRPQRPEWLELDLSLAPGALEPMPITRLNHAVLFVRDADAAAEFYRRAFGFEELSRPQGMRAAFMRSPTGGNHHDLGLFEVGREAPRPPRGSVGLYHLAWEIDTIEALAEMAKSLTELGALTGASDHGVSKSLYGRDPDGNEFEVMWSVPREAWGQFADEATVMPLDLEAEVRRWGAGATVQ